MNEHVGILLCLGAAVVHLLGRAAVLAFAILPSVGAVGVQDVAALPVKTGDAVLPIGLFAAIDTSAGQVGGEFRDGNAEYLLVQDVVDAELTVRHLRLQPAVQSFDNLPEKDAALGERVQEFGVRTLE